MVIWGCGAIGGHIAEWIARTGPARLILYDNAAVTPGILARQPFTDNDVGRAKAAVVGDRLTAIDPNLTIETRIEDVLTGPLARDVWHDGSDILIDATAAVAVASKLEAIRYRTTDRPTLVAMLLGHTAEHGICAIASTQHTGASADVLRRAKLACTSRPGLEGFAQEFWPDPPRSEHFQPEPGCSDATFRGSGAEVSAVTATLLTAAASEIATSTPQATAHLCALPSAAHVGRRSARLTWPPDIVVADGLGRYEIRISQSAQSAMQTWVDRNARVGEPHSETGGVLFGQRDQAAGVLWIDDASGPPPDSIASPEEFVCSTAGVAERNTAIRTRTRRSTAFVGMWHTHPDGPALPSPRDITSMSRLVSLEPLPEPLMLINGTRDEHRELGGYVFARDELPQPFGLLVIHDRTAQPAPRPPAPRTVGLALSGGGSRAIAFHLGCLRALQDRGTLVRVRVISGVSGGAIATAAYTYSHDPSREELRAKEVRKREETDRPSERVDVDGRDGRVGRSLRDVLDDEVLV